MNIAFVVLHYCQVDVTLNCIESIQRINGNPYIVVVDNASPDGSGLHLKHRFGCCNQIVVILNDDNLGFAAANNIGFLYAKQELGADVIVVVNNDTIIKDTLFIDKLLASSYLDRCHIIAPNIINIQGTHQNPKALKPASYDTIVRNYKRAKILRLIYSIPLLGDVKAAKRESLPRQNNAFNTISEMIVPHGAAVIYTPLWVNKEDFAFYPGTFMYVEETLLYYYVLYKGYRTVYLPDLVVFHLEDVSTKSRFKNRRKRALFQVNNAIHSHEVLIDFIDKNQLK